MLMDSAKLASFGAVFAGFARPAQLVAVLPNAVWAVERHIHSCIAGCHARDILDRGIDTVRRVTSKKGCLEPGQELIADEKK